jgi:ribosome-binding factor A
MLALLRAHRAELQQLLNHALFMKYTPRLTFELDTSVEEGDHVLAVLKMMEDGEKDSA